MAMRCLRFSTALDDDGRSRCLGASLLLLTMALLLGGAAAAKDINGSAVVIDGDTLDIGDERVRLHGIDAPESTQACQVAGLDWPCGREATRFLSDSAGTGAVFCRGSKRDRYGRLIAVCYVGGSSLNATMVAHGWALAYRKYSLDYVAEEDAARSAGRGVWRGQFIEPWQWRLSRRTIAEALGDVRP